MSLYGKEKIWFLVNRLLDEREITSLGEPVGLHPMNDLNNHYGMSDFVQLLTKLEEENVAKLISLPTDQTFLKYQIELLPDFDKYVAKLEDDPEYLEWSGKTPNPRTLALGNTVDFSKTSEENKDKYISIGQIAQLEEMPEDEQLRVKRDSLTEKHRKDIEEAGKTTRKLIESIQQNFKINIPKIEPPVLSDVAFALPPNYEAEQVRLLRQLVNQQEAAKQTLGSGQAVSITYTKSRQVLLNDMFQLSRPTLNGENDLVFNYLYQHPNQSHTKKQLEAELSNHINKPLHKIVENLGFKGDLAKAFFSVSKDSIVFRNPITADELSQMGLSIIRLNKSNDS